MLAHVKELILKKLITSESLRYSDLRPEEVDDDLYNYHLQDLVKRGYAEKSGKGYSLSDKGKEYVQNFDAAGKYYGYFGLMVIAVVIDKQKGEILIQRRTRHPYFGDAHPGISGKIMFGEKVEQAAKRKLKEETNLDCEFEFLGVIRKTRRKEDKDVFEDSLYHYCLGFNPKGDLVEENDFGENFWAPLGDAMKYEKAASTSGEYSQAVLEKILKNDFFLFYYHEDVTVPTV